MKIRYRPEIDGLRAIAILAVIAYHAKFIFFGKNIFTGGYLGVDIFFVISGYLITSIIIKELNSSSHFSFSNFASADSNNFINFFIWLDFFTSLKSN